MATTVGTSGDLNSLISDFVTLEHDAIAAYDTTIERLENPAFAEKVREFRADHQRHLTELTGLATRYGATLPQEGDAKQILTTGKVKLADLVGGDGAILKAMGTNENDTVSAYKRGAENEAIPLEDREIFRRAHADEERHKAWMDETARSL